MNKKLKRLEIVGLVWGILASFVFHFLYELTNNNKLVGLIAPVSESVWEHGKLLVFPFLIFAIVEYFILKPKDKANFFATKFLVAIINVLLLPVLFYTYSGIIGTHIVIIDILIAIVLVLLSYYISYSLLRLEHKFTNKYVMIIFGIAFVLLFFVFTFYPPSLGWFISPQ